MSLPKPTMEILTAEADVWGVARGDFLTMLLRRRSGDLAFERPKTAPAYPFKARDFDETERYAWYLRKSDLPKLESDRLKLGNVSPANWVRLALNDWIGWSDAVTEPGHGRRVLLHRPLRVLPTDHTPAEPYWALVEVDENGAATGLLWGHAPGTVLLLSSRTDAQEALQIMTPPLGEPNPSKAQGVDWAIRGISSGYLAALRAAPSLELFVASFLKGGELVADPLA
jgi:hypothetical protein